MTVPCLLAAWSAHEAELRRYLRHCLADRDEADDLLHDLFLKACRQGEAFCAVSQPRAWLFEVARNTVLDHLRRRRPTLPLPPDLAAAEPAETGAPAAARATVGGVPGKARRGRAGVLLRPASADRLI